MTPPFLVISDPPHGEVDRRHAARCFGLSPAEAAMKANFGAPEIWMADPDRAVMEDLASQLAASGLSSQVVPGTDLATLPTQQIMTRFEATDTGWSFTGEQDKVALGYDDPIVGVFCKPPSDFAPRKRASRSLADGIGRNQSAMFIDGLVGSAASGSTEDVERATFVDLYTSANGSTRMSLPQDLLDFSGLGKAGPNPDENMLTLVAELTNRFSRLRMDRRLENVRPRLRPMVGRPAPHEEDRRLFSYGTQALTHLLASIAPDLVHLAQYELGSRIGFLLARAGG